MPPSNLHFFHAICLPASQLSGVCTQSFLALPPHTPPSPSHLHFLNEVCLPASQLSGMLHLQLLQRLQKRAVLQTSVVEGQ